MTVLESAGKSMLETGYRKRTGKVSASMDGHAAALQKTAVDEEGSPRTPPPESGPRAPRASSCGLQGQSAGAQKNRKIAHETPRNGPAVSTASTTATKCLITKFNYPP
jgi:hypothetical protein